MCRFAPEISADKEENRRNPDGFQDFLTQSSGNLWREAVCGDLISGSLNKELTPEEQAALNQIKIDTFIPDIVEVLPDEDPKYLDQTFCKNFDIFY